MAIECEGGFYARGRHVRGKGYEQDLEKYNSATVLGWRVLRFSKRMIEQGDALDMISFMVRSVSHE